MLNPSFTTLFLFQTPNYFLQHSPVKPIFKKKKKKKISIQNTTILFPNPNQT